MSTSRLFSSGLTLGFVLLAGVAQAQGAAKAHPDLTGTYDNVADLATAASATLAKPGQSVCLYSCGDAAGARGGGGAAARGGGGGGARAGGGGGRGGAPADRPQYKPEFLAKVKDLTDRQVDEDLALRCGSPGVPRIGPPEKIIQNDKDVVFLYEDISGPFFRIIPIDGRAHRSDAGRTPLGDAVGRWEGDTLVVETVNFTENTWLTDNGAFHSKDLRVVERLRKVDDSLEWQATSYDPAVLVEPWAKAARVMKPARNEILVSPQCQDLSLSQMLDKSSHANPR